MALDPEMKLNKYGKGKELKMEDMTSKEFKTLLEMILLIIESCKTTEEAIEKIKGLDILKND